MKITEDIQKAIVEHPSDDLATVAREVGQQHGTHIPITSIVRIRGSMERAANVNRAKTRASGELDQGLDRINRASGELETAFFDDTIPLKERLEISKELRQWTKMGMDAAGIHDEESDLLFVVEGAWDPNAT